MTSFYVVLCCDRMVGDNKSENERASVILCSEVKEEYIRSGFNIYEFPEGLARQLYCELSGVNEDNVSDFPFNEKIAVFSAEDFILDAANNLLGISNEYMLRFTLSYCMSLDLRLFFSFMNHLFSFDMQFEYFILSHQYKPWPVYKYAELLGLSYSKFRMLFTDKFGECPKKWFLFRRLQRACTLLETTSMKIIDIAFESGFSSQSYFTDCFRKYYCQAPGDVRKKGNISVLSELKNEF